MIHILIFFERGIPKLLLLMCVRVCLIHINIYMCVYTRVLLNNNYNNNSLHVIHLSARASKVFRLKLRNENDSIFILQ